MYRKDRTFCSTKVNAFFDGFIAAVSVAMLAYFPNCPESFAESQSLPNLLRFAQRCFMFTGETQMNR